MRIEARKRPPGTDLRPRLEIRDLETVLAVAAAGSTTRAASALHITQSAVSRALRLAEERAGAKLFDRTRHGLSPTPEGERLIGGAGPILAGLSELEQRIGSSAVVEPTRVRLVCECYTAYRWLPSALQSLRRTLPQLEVRLAVEHTQDPASALGRGDIDIALLTTAALPGPRSARVPLYERPLFSDEIVFVLSKSHKLAAQKSLTRADLCSTTLITSHTPPAEARWFLRSVFGRAKPKLDFLPFPLTEAIIDGARAGMGVAIMSEWIAKTYLEAPDLLVKRLASGPLRRPWRIAFRRDAAGAVERLIGALEGSAPRLRANRPS
jgi:LysR family transcriptional regulator, regulator for metE and metH